MLGKLIKHELKAMLNKFSIIGIIFLIVAVIVRVMTLFQNQLEDSISFMMSFVFITSAFMIGLVGLNFFALFISVSRFQKNLFGDEGYLMHTLPVPSYYHIITKFVSGLVTWIVAVIIDGVSISIAFFGVDEISEIFKAINDLFYVCIHYPVQAFSMFLTIATAYCALIFLCYLCVSITNSIPKGKSLINALIVIGAIIVNNIITSLIMNIAIELGVTSPTSAALIYAGYFAIVSVAFFFFTNMIMTRNLNLE